MDEQCQWLPLLGSARLLSLFFAGELRLEQQSSRSGIAEGLIMATVNFESVIRASKDKSAFCRPSGWCSGHTQSQSLQVDELGTWLRQRVRESVADRPLQQTSALRQAGDELAIGLSSLALGQRRQVGVLRRSSGELWGDGWAESVGDPFSAPPGPAIAAPRSAKRR
ncbi:hypothetical protein CC79DRAFT_1327712 [Sarocladium strictum]